MTKRERIQKIYSDYLNTIVPLIERYEVWENKFPVGVLNEIRALFTHVAKAESLQGKSCDVEIGKAEGHITRLLRDCYKYNCVSLERRYSEYISVSNKSEVVKFVAKHDEALDALFLAKCIEGSVSAYEKEQEIYENYEKAFNIYKEIVEELKDNIAKK